MALPRNAFVACVAQAPVGVGEAQALEGVVENPAGDGVLLAAPCLTGAFLDGEALGEAPCGLSELLGALRYSSTRLWPPRSGRGRWLAARAQVMKTRAATWPA